MDEVCPPTTVFAAYNAYKGAKEITVYPYGAHEQMPAQIPLIFEFLETAFRATPDPA